MDLYTKNGHDLRLVVSCLQKAIRRGDVKLAGYCANEMFGRYNQYLWRRLLVISAEDCGDCVTKELMALMEAEDVCNKNRKGYDREKIFVSKAIILLCKARHNRDADFFCCELMQSEEIVNIEDGEFNGFPEYVFDVRTARGRARGETITTFVEKEQAELANKAEGYFDNEEWPFTAKHYRKKIDAEIGFPQPTKEQLAELMKEDGQLELF